MEESVTDKRYSLVVVLIAAAVAVGIAVFSLGSGLLVGYQWGRSAGRAEAFEELPEIGARSIGPLLEEFLPRGGLEGLFPRDRGPGGQPFEFEPSNQPYLGVNFRMITPELRAQEDLDEEQGALIVEVVPGSPADEAGLRRGDIIHAVDGALVNENHHLAELIESYKPGESVELTVIRNGRRITIDVELGLRPGGSSLEGFEG
jgi:membrane-associated protease RseP (regulator of RpoE activity)